MPRIYGEVTFNARPGFVPRFVLRKIPVKGRISRALVPAVIYIRMEAGDACVLFFFFFVLSARNLSCGCTPEMRIYF